MGPAFSQCLGPLSFYKSLTSGLSLLFPFLLPIESPMFRNTSHILRPEESKSIIPLDTRKKSNALSNFHSIRTKSIWLAEPKQNKHVKFSTITNNALKNSTFNLKILHQILFICFLVLSLWTELSHMFSLLSKNVQAKNPIRERLKFTNTEITEELGLNCKAEHYYR